MDMTVGMTDRNNDGRAPSQAEPHAPAPPGRAAGAPRDAPNDAPNDALAGTPNGALTGTLAGALAQVRARITAACRRAGRPDDAAALVAVSKTHGADAVRALLACGQTAFGENRVQEAAAKFPALRADWPDLRLHLIGGLQTNKAEDAVRLADVIESIDRPKLVEAVARAADRLGRLPTLLVQVNTGAEPQKSGVDLAAADALIELCRARFGGHLAGLMCIPPAEEDPTPHFRTLAALASRHGLGVLSMGMSGDYEAAIAAGATHVRVGSAIFGARGVPASRGAPA
jgi:pyridoxal phosphate enzyme (YggS family)